MLQKLLKTILIFFLFFIFIKDILAENIPTGYKDLSNKVISDVFKKIMTEKNDFPELEGLSEDNFSKNEYDVYAIKYISPERKSKRNPPFQFALTIVPINVNVAFNQMEGQFEVPFPFLGIKIIGYQFKNNTFNDFNIYKYIRGLSGVLLSEQNKKMPILLELKPTKESFNIGEKISFEVSVTNKTEKAILVRELNNISLFIKYRNIVWGNEKVTGDAIKRVQTKVIQPNESLAKIFTGNAYYEPQEFSVYCVYRMTFQGINPSIYSNIRIAEPKSN